MTLAATPALAITDDEGLWYYSATGMDDIHQTTRGEGITIAIMDSPINPDFPDLVGANLNVHEPSFCAAEEGGPALPATSTAAEANHGTGLTSLLIGTGVGINGQAGIPGIAPGITVNYYTTHFDTPGSDLAQCPIPEPRDPRGAPETAAVYQAIEDGADIISFSTGASRLTDESIVAAQRAGVILVGSGGNRPGGVYETPAKRNGVIAVGSVTPEITLWENSPRGPELGVVAPGVNMRVPNFTFDGYMTASGSSLAAPFTAGALALAWSQHPDATANQMIQALFRTTGGTTHGLQRDDEAGYGLVSPYQLLQVDPTTFPDENPMLFDAVDRYPLVADVLEPTPTPTPEATPTRAPLADTGASADDTDDSTGAPMGLIAGIAGAAAVALILTVVLIGRRRTAPADPNDAAAD
jgi:hypothetical protein